MLMAATTVPEGPRRYDAGMAPTGTSLPQLVELAARRYAAALRDRYRDDVVLVRLFGSYARGEAHEDSDVDIAVVLEDLDFPTERDVIDLATTIGWDFELDLAPNAFDRDTYEKWRRQQRPLVMDIEREGIAL